MQSNAALVRHYEAAERAEAKAEVDAREREAREARAPACAMIAPRRATRPKAHERNDSPANCPRSFP
jgi:hypothetical protein